MVDNLVLFTHLVFDEGTRLVLDVARGSAGQTIWSRVSLMRGTSNAHDSLLYLLHAAIFSSNFLYIQEYELPHWDRNEIKSFLLEVGFLLFGFEDPSRELVCIIDRFYVLKVFSFSYIKFYFQDTGRK